MMPRPPFQPALSFPLFALRHRRRRRRIHIQLPLILYIRRLTLPDSPSLHTALSSPFNFFQTPPPLPTTPHLRPPSPPPPRISYKSRNDK